MDSILIDDDTVVDHRPLRHRDPDVSGALSRCSIQLGLENDLSLVRGAAEMLIDTCWWCGEFPQNVRCGLKLALEEALTNAVVHGNLEVSSTLREAADGAYEKLIRLRRHKHPFATRMVHASCVVSREEAQFEIRDDGCGFDPRTIADPRDPARITLASGRGILLMRTFMDDVRFNETGNAVTLIKRRMRSHGGSPKQSES